MCFYVCMRVLSTRWNISDPADGWEMHKADYTLYPSCLACVPDRRDTLRRVSDGPFVCLNLSCTDVHWGLRQCVLGTCWSKTLSYCRWSLLYYNAFPCLSAPLGPRRMPHNGRNWHLKSPRANANLHQRKLRRHERPFVISNNRPWPTTTMTCVPCFYQCFI